MSTCPGIRVDMDIAGIGVRTAFYVQSFCLVFAASIPGSDVKGAFWTLAATSLAVLLYTSIQSGIRTLTFHNAILVSYFCVLHTVASLTAYILMFSPFRGLLFKLGRSGGGGHDFNHEVVSSSGSSIKSTGSYAPLKGEDPDQDDTVPPHEVSLALRIAMLVYYRPCSIPLALQYSAVYIYSFSIWSLAASFGGQAACNAATQLRFFGGAYGATGGGRAVALICLSLLVSFVAVPAVFAGWSILAQAMQMGTFKLWKRAANTPPPPRFGVHTLPIILCFLYVWLYTIVTVEQTIHSAAVINGVVQWTFRQIFPLVSTIVPVTTVYYSIKKFWIARVAENAAQRQLLLSPSPLRSGSVTPTRGQSEVEPISLSDSTYGQDSLLPR